MYTESLAVLYEILSPKDFSFKINSLYRIFYYPSNFRVRYSKARLWFRAALFTSRWKMLFVRALEPQWRFHTAPTKISATRPGSGHGGGLYAMELGYIPIWWNSRDADLLLVIMEYHCSRIFAQARVHNSANESRGEQAHMPNRSRTVCSLGGFQSRSRCYLSGPPHQFLLPLDTMVIQSWRRRWQGVIIGYAKWWVHM